MATIEPSLHKNFTLRGESYKAGMLLLIAHLTESDWKLGNKFSARLDLISKKIETLYKDYENDLKDKKTSFEAGNGQLKRLIASYISILVFHTTLKDPFQSLRDAERCAVWYKGRRTFVTQVPIVGEDSRLKLLKIAQSETPYTDNDSLLQEYVSASKTFWFESLPQWQQDFIKKNGERLSKHSIPSSLRSVPGLANLSMHHCYIDSDIFSYFRHATQTPIDLMDKQAGDEQFRLSCLNLASQIRLSLDKQLNSSNSLDRQELVILTQSLLSPGSAATFKSEYFTDASDNDTRLYEMKERIVELFQAALSNPNEQIAVKDEKIKALFFKEEEQAEAIYYKDFLAKFDLMANSDGSFKYKGSKFKITLLSTNHPFNILRRLGVHPDQTKRNDTNTAGLLGAVGRYLTPFLIEKTKIRQPDRWPAFSEYLDKVKLLDDRNAKLSELKKILDPYKKNETASVNADRKKLIDTLEGVLDPKMSELFDKNTIRLLDALQALLSIPIAQGVFTTDTRHYQMQISSAEATILHCIGGTLWVACKSGKDRTGGASVANDAAATFYALQGRHPRHDDGEQDRAVYLELLKSFFESGHQQHVASENAPGAEGLVKSTFFFPNDLQLDAENIQLETQLARLNKPKAVSSHSESLNHRILNEDLQDIKNRTINITLGKNPILFDWQRNWTSYFINGKSVRELRKDKEFEDEDDLSEFMETHLLTQIESEELKKYYKSLILYSFHHGGFPHSFSKLSQGVLNQHYLQSPNKAISGQPDVRINFSWSEEGKGIQIEEINTYKEKRDLNTGEVLLPEKGEYYCQTQSCILLKLSEAKDGAYQLAVNIQSANVDCVDDLKPLFFKRANLLEVFIHYLQSLLAVIKCYFDKLVKSGPVLNESWFSKTNSAFFQKSMVTTEHEERAIQNQLQGAISFSIPNNK